MATNDFQPFAYGGAANVVTQSAYLALTSTLQNGFSSGVATSAQLNKVWRQSSIMSAVLAQLIVNTTGQNATDDGTTATLLTNLINAISANSEATIGAVRNLSMSVTAASASATLTADEIVVGSALGGLKYTLASFSKTINLATTGAGGMDTGSAPASGYVALYAIYNPTTGTSALLATNAATKQGNVYGGANMPAGYTASALVGMWPTNSSSQFVVGYQADRTVNTAFAVAGNTTSQIASLTALSISAFVPPNARTVSGFLSITSTNANQTQINIAGSSSGIGQIQCSGFSSAGGSLTSVAPYSKCPVITQQTIYWQASLTSGTFSSATVYISSYDF